MWLSNSANLAIFFLIIRMVYRVPDENSQIGAKGSTINNFTFLHPAFTSSSSDLKPQKHQNSLLFHQLLWFEIKQVSEDSESNINPGANSAKLFIVEPLTEENRP